MAGDNALDLEPIPAELKPIPGHAFAWSFTYQIWGDAVPNICMRTRNVSFPKGVG